MLGDFCVSDRHRSLGPALKLQRSCLELAADSATPFWYDFPSRAMMTVYQRLRIAPRGQMRRLVKLLRVEHKLAAIAGASARCAEHRSVVLDGLRGATARPSHHVSRLVAGRSTRGRSGRSSLISPSGRAPSYGMCLKRSAAYLNWRYREIPTAAYEIVTARPQGRLSGYAVFSVRCGAGATLADLFGTQDRRILGGPRPGRLRASPAAAVELSLSVSLLGLASVGRPVPPPRASRAARQAPSSSAPRRVRRVDTVIDSGLLLMSGDRDS